MLGGGWEEEEKRGGSSYTWKFPFHVQAWMPIRSSQRACLGGRGTLGRAGSPEHVVVAVYLSAHAGVVEDAPVAHHGTADALGAPRWEAGQEQLLLCHWGEACHHILHHWNGGFHSELCKGQGSGAGGPQGRGRSETKSQLPSAMPGTHPAPGQGLTGKIELHEAKGRGKVLQAVPLTPVEMSGVQEEGEVGQKEFPEPE